MQKLEQGKFKQLKTIKEKIIRSRIFWILFPVWFFNVALSLFNQGFDLFNILKTFFSFLILIPMAFTIGWLVPGYGIDEMFKLLNFEFSDNIKNNIIYILIALFDVGYVLLLIKIKKINKKWLYIIFIILLIILAFGAKGCANFSL